MGERVRRGSKELAVEGAGTRPGRGLKYRVIWGFLMPDTPYMFKQARGTDQPRLQGLLLGSREAGGGRRGPRPGSVPCDLSPAEEAERQGRRVESFFASTSDEAAKAKLGSSRICAWVCA